VAVLTRVEPTIDGSDPVFVIPTITVGDSFPVDDDTVLHVRNASGGSINVTLTSTATAEPGVAAANKVVAVGAGLFRDIRIKPSRHFRDANGRCTAVCSAVASVTVAVTRVA
jgi:hypothetical protein